MSLHACSYVYQEVPHQLRTKRYACSCMLLQNGLRDFQKLCLSKNDVLRLIRTMHKACQAGGHRLNLDVVIDYTYECSARTSSSPEPQRCWTERCRIGPTPPKPSMEALLELTTECNVSTAIPVGKSVGGFSVDCVKQGEPVIMTTEDRLETSLVGFAFCFFSSYFVHLAMVFVTARQVWTRWQSVTEYARKNVASCPLKNLLECQYEYPEAFSRLNLMNLNMSNVSHSHSESGKNLLIDQMSPCDEASEQFEAALSEHHQIQLELRKSCLFIVPVAFLVSLMCMLYLVFLQIHWRPEVVVITSSMVTFVGMCVPTFCITPK